MNDRQLQAEVGARMKQAATDAGLGAYEVAAALGVRPPTVYRWWQGESRTDRATMARYANLVRRPQIWLESGEAATEYLAAALRRWIEAAASGIGGDLALKEVDAEIHAADPALANDLREFAPRMLGLIEEISGRAWASLAEAEKTAAVRRLVEILDQQRSPSG